MEKPSFRYFPVGNGMRSGVEVDAYFHDGQSAECEAGWVVLEVDLPHGSFSGTVEFDDSSASFPFPTGYPFVFSLVTAE